MSKPEDLEDLVDPVDIPLDLPTPEKGLSESVAASVAAAQSALEDSMQKASALQMTAMQTAIGEFKAAAEQAQGLVTQLTETLSLVEDLKAETLELVEALSLPSKEDLEDLSGGGRIEESNLAKPKHIQILKTILSK
jgi:hypothetical protein